MNRILDPRRLVPWCASLLAFALALCAVVPAAASTDAKPLPFALAYAEADASVSLEEIVSGRARVGFTPVVGEGVLALGRKDRAVWLRLKLDLPQDGTRLILSLPRQSIDRMRLYHSPAAGGMIAETGMAVIDKRVRWPDLQVLPLSTQLRGPTTLYVEINGRGYLSLQPVLRSEPQLQERARGTVRGYDALYAGLLLIGLLAMLRQWLTGERGARIALAAFACLIASVVTNHHLQLSIGGASLASIPALPVVLWTLACAPLIWATQHYAGHERNFPAVAKALDRIGFGFVAIGIALLFVPPQYLGQLQVAGLFLLAVTAVMCIGSILFDPRQWRWGPILVWAALLPALLALYLSMLQLLPASMLVRRGFQFLLAVQLAIYLALPWIRHAVQHRQKRKRAVVVELSAEEKIAHAREWMLSSLQAGIEGAGETDVEWIAYRRLMGGLKPVLPQSAAAVIAMNYHNEDLLLAEPKSAQARFQMLLAQRGSLLKNLSRSLAPQQIALDLNGPDGVLHIPMAIIPLPIDRPGWGVLVIERSPNITYSDDELDLCTEFAALATTAGDEAAEVMKIRQASEVDGESGVYKASMSEELLRRAHEQALAKGKPLSVLRIGIDGYDALAADAISSSIRTIADMLRDEIVYGETIARTDIDEFLVSLPGRAIGDARLLGERICTSVHKRGLATRGDGQLMISMGVSQLQPGERTLKLMLDRAAKGLAKARQWGGNQVQAVTSSTS